jgi:cytochrome c2
MSHAARTAAAVGIVAFLSAFCSPTEIAFADPIHTAARDGNVEEVARLLDEGADPNAVTVGTPLYFASQRGHLEVVALLLDHGADVNAVTRFGTPLQIAARSNHVEIVELLLSHGADPQILGGDFGNAPLHDAAERGSMEAAALLLENGADINQRNKEQWPAIHLAMREKRYEMADWLREQGAAPMPVEPLAPGELAAADLDAGRIRAIECAQCHPLELSKKTISGPGPLGPLLWNVVGRAKATMTDYPYSDAMAAQTGTWTFDELNRFLADAPGVVPGTNMQRGFEPDRSKRISVIAYLRTLSDDPVPLD